MVSQMGGQLARTFVGRVVLIWAAATAGWTIGTLMYFGYLYVAFKPPKPGELHPGLYLLGFVGLVIAVRMTRRWIARVRWRDGYLD
jgi:hypothetical protein